jgi:hypothetical protein
LVDPAVPRIAHLRGLSNNLRAASFRLPEAIPC